MICIACLNLPIEERYRPENMFIHIIPGPKEPEAQLDGMNPYLRPIVDEFLDLWLGVAFSRTADFPHGRLILCAIALVICDLMMVRKVGGFTSIHHEYFCSRCWCSRTAHKLSNFDVKSWKLRTDEECRDLAENYFSASSPEEAASLVRKLGLQWTELLWLPYYKASTCLVINVMHNLFLGLIKEYF